LVPPEKSNFVPGKSTVAHAIRRFKLMKGEDLNLVALIVQVGAAFLRPRMARPAPTARAIGTSVPRKIS